MKRKYPFSLFLFGFLINLIGRFSFIFLAAVVLLLIGIWVDVCRHIGILLLLLDGLLSLVEQLMIRKATLDESDNPDFKEFQDAAFSSDWHANIMNFLQNKMDQGDHFDDSDGDSDSNNDNDSGDDCDPHDSEL